MRADRDRLLDVLEAIDRIKRHTTDGRQRFDEDELIQVWVLHNLQVIGEAVRGLSDDAVRGHPGIPWAQIVGMRNVIVHGYFGVDLDILWGVVERELPVLERDVRAILDSV